MCFTSHLLHAHLRRAQQALAARDSSFARFNLSPEDVRQWRLEQQQLESFAAATRRQSHGTTAAESIGTQGRTWHTVARDPQRADPPLAAQGQHGLVVYAPLPGVHRCATAVATTEAAGAHSLATLAGLSSQAHQVATSAPIESAANDLALLVANVRNPHRLRAIQNCLEDSQMSQGAAAPAQVAPDAQQLRAAQRRHKHRPDQKKVLRDWFDAHAIDPYPTTEEKAQLAQLAGMDVKQVENCAQPHQNCYRPSFPLTIHSCMCLGARLSYRRVHKSTETQLASCEGG